MNNHDDEALVNSLLLNGQCLYGLRKACSLTDSVASRRVQTYFRIQNPPASYVYMESVKLKASKFTVNFIFQDHNIVKFCIYRH
jgi:hypothetical protein